MWSFIGVLTAQGQNIYMPGFFFHFSETFWRDFTVQDTSWIFPLISYHAYVLRCFIRVYLSLKHSDGFWCIFVSNKPDIWCVVYIQNIRWNENIIFLFQHRFQYINHSNSILDQPLKDLWDRVCWRTWVQPGVTDLQPWTLVPVISWSGACGDLRHIEWGKTMGHLVVLVLIIYEEKTYLELKWNWK